MPTFRERELELAVFYLTQALVRGARFADQINTANLSHRLPSLQAHLMNEAMYGAAINQVAPQMIYEAKANGDFGKIKQVIDDRLNGDA